MKLRIGALLLAAAACVQGSIPAAASVSSAVTVSGSVISNCTTISPTINGVAGTTYTIGSSYDPFTYPAGNPLRNTTPLTLSTNCTKGDTVTAGTPIRWTVGDGSHCNQGATANDRAMTDSASPTTHYLSYELYTDSGFGTPWSTNNCGTPPSTSQDSKGVSVTNSISLYGQVPGGQSVPTGTYSDSVVVTLSY